MAPRAVSGSTERAAERPPRVVLRFAIYMAVTLVVMACGFLWTFRGYARTDAERAVRFHALALAQTVLRDRLVPADFVRPAAGARLGSLDRLFRRDVVGAGTLRVKLFAPDGLVTYSDDHALVGTHPVEPAVEAALAGTASFDVTRLDHEGGAGPNALAVEAYVPVALGGERASGVFELYQEYAPVAAAARSVVVPVAGGLAVTLAALYAALLPVLRRMTRRLREHAAETEYRALHDELTGLPNRWHFRRRVAEAAERASGSECRFAILLLDLDRFKEVNDTLGHRCGDVVLQEVGRRLREALRAGDSVARLGGDEFSLLVADVQEPADALAVAARIRASLDVPVTVDDVLLDLEASVGVACAPGDGEDVDTLLRRADIAMYVAKELRTGVELYSPARDHYSPERLQLVAELRHAIAAGELVCEFQPQAALLGGHASGVEALVRWPHPVHGLLGPDAFVPLAERTGLIRGLTSLVLREAVAQCRSWAEHGAEIPVWVNITGRDLLDLELPNEVRRLLEEAELEPRLLGLEITENTILSDPGRARTILSRLDALGVRLAIDDFGRGNSSLAYLKRLPLHALKIDQSFVRTMAQDADNAIIVRSTIDLAHNLGLAVIAEGVETPDAWNRLVQLGCDSAQGWFVGRPTAGDALLRELGADGEDDDLPEEPAAAVAAG